MNDRSIVQMEATLTGVARGFAYPAPPSLVAGVEARLGEPARRGWRPLLRFAAAAAAIAMVVLGAALAVPQSRTALADFFGLSHVRIEFDDLVGDAPPRLAPEAYARPISLEDAQARADFRIGLPTDEGEALPPDEVFVRGWETAGAPTVILLYEAFDLSESRFGFFGKGGLPEVFEEVEVAGRDAIWIEEGGHVAWFIDDEGRAVVESRRLVERATLLWDDASGVTYRLETSLPQDEAIALAESVR